MPAWTTGDADSIARTNVSVVLVNSTFSEFVGVGDTNAWTYFDTKPEPLQRNVLLSLVVT